MKKYLLLLLITIFIFTASGHAQFTRYIVKLKDKGTNPYSISNPSQYLSARAIQRRARYNIAIDSTDLPITPRYLDSIRLSGAVSILNVSKWLNQVAIQTTDAAALAKINSFPFVISTNPIAAIRQQEPNPVNKKLDVLNTGNPGPNNNPQQTNDYYNYGQSYGQVHLTNGEFLHNRGFRGQGMQMAILDAGFYHYLSLPTFDSVRANNQVLDTWNYVSGNASVNLDNAHGMECFSTIAANMPGTFMGEAPKASFYLFVTEDISSEYPVEEQNWAAGIERADSSGIDVSSTSLGYSLFDNPIFNYTYADMNGHTTIIARAANMAARKGIIVVVAAGNEGYSAWHYILTPGDADSVIAVGAVDINGVVGGFSSYGPNSSGQIKPAVAAVGVNAVVANPGDGSPAYGSGTSFACPNMAGITTCLWQAFPEVNNMNIVSTLEVASDRATNPDNRTGYGIPNMKKAFVMLIKQLYTRQSSFANCASTLQWTVKTDSAMSIVVERKLSTDINYTAINTQTSIGAFALRNFSFTDNVTGISTSPVSYRIKMNIALDTSFYLDTITVNFSPKPNLGADINTSICNGNNYNLTTAFTTTGLNTSWTIGGTTVPNPSAVNANGTYQLIAINNSGCADTALVNLTVNPKPNLGADKSFTKCSTDIYDLTAQFVTTGLTSSWTLAGTPVASPTGVTGAGAYQLIATNSFGCADTALLTLTNDPQICTYNLVNQILVNPNPVTDILTVTVIRNAAITEEIVLINSAGQRVYSLSAQQPAGSKTFSIPMKQLPVGIYFISVKVNGKKELVKKILKG